MDASPAIIDPLQQAVDFAMKTVIHLIMVALFAAGFGSAGAQQRPQKRPISQFFDAFTDEWMRFHTDSAAATRYLREPEQDRVERLLMPQTREMALQRIALAKKGLA